MATYFTGDPGILAGENGGSGSGGGLGLHTMILMNPTTYVHFNSDQYPPLNHEDNSTNTNNNVVSAVLHGFIPRVYGTPVEAAREPPRARHGLSLSLSSEQPRSPYALSSKYLKAAQELLDEVASVKNNYNTSTENSNVKSFSSKKSCDEDATGGDETSCEATAAALITAAERQEIQMKKAKLVTMLDEVDQRYKQYKNQMKIAVSSFERAAGTGSAKTYTSLALKTISKQFRSLKDFVIAQIKAVSKSLGEEEEAKIEGGSSSMLKFVDRYHIRQQRALQHLGMIHHSNNTWRPQRGLPERSVSVLRAWLFEHFLHPYPKDSDKIMLAKQAGLTRSQVSNWFINARVRLWKPMVEEMYLEEVKEQEKNNGSSKAKANPKEHQDEDSMSKSDKQEKSPVSEVLQSNFMVKQVSFMNNNDHSTISMSIPVTASASATGFSLMGASELEGAIQGSPKKPCTSVSPMNMEANTSPRLRDEKEFSFVASNTNFMGGFGPYTIGETARFEAEPFTPSYSGNSNGVSLTLGLPHCESFSVSATHQNFLPNQNIQLGRDMEVSEPNEFGAISASESHPSAAAYNTVSLQNQTRFAAQLLPDFVT